ncbi:UDP-glucose/GDP-mannose dehydrogenase family protein [Candidatus Gracilibacteria bacterium 28_42_T64]|nr:UDP-glucose/GDP-mannose dehydrogenase family protein [Candidatus Gracilibacteria bacterium 28_42_T64]
MKITVFGTGYVGLVTGTCLAEVGHEVMCIDIDQNKIDNLEKGIIPIYEPGLEELVLRNHKEGRLVFSTDAKKGIAFGKAIFSAVGTPPDENHKADLRFVKAVAQTVGENVSDYKVFINKSTVPVGTGKLCKDIISEEIKKRSAQVKIDIVSNPEFLKEGMAIRDFMGPDRIVCGLESEKAKEIMKEIYKPFIRTDRPLIFTDLKSSEIIKYAANAFLATKISFINEIANFAEIVGANIGDISKGIGLDDRIGHRFLQAGIGYGGSCFPKDVQALIETGKEYNYDFKIIKATEEVNKLQKTKVIDKVLEKIDSLEGKTISIWGLSFKPKTDDIREAPSIDVINKLLELGVKEIKAFDPVAMSHMRKEYNGNNVITFGENYYDVLNESDALIVLTEWDEFRIPNFEKMKSLMNGNVIIDGRNLWRKEEMEKLGFDYSSIGR